jgi:hypothetical protein
MDMPTGRLGLHPFPSLVWPGGVGVIQGRDVVPEKHRIPLPAVGFLLKILIPAPAPAPAAGIAGFCTESGICWNPCIPVFRRVRESVCVCWNARMMGSVGHDFV